MAKRIIQDVVPSSGKSIRNVHIQKREDAVKIVREEFERRGKKNKKFLRYGILAVALIVIIISFFTMNAFAHATVDVTLATTSVPVDNTLNTKIPKDSTSVGDKVIYVIKQGSAKVEATGVENIETKASGTIIVFNNYSASPQKLVINTRFQTPQGLIYRITQSISVPGKTVKNGKTTPGSTEAQVRADKAGDSYNIGLSDFTVPGFKGEPQYDSIFARSKTSMTGGFSGTRPVVTDAARATAEGGVRLDLESAAISAAKNLVPLGYILYPGAYRIDYTSLPDANSEDEKSIIINEEISLTAFALNRSDVSSVLAKARLSNYSGESITITNIQSLSFSPKDTIPTASTTPFSFKLSGKADFVWNVDAKTFATVLAGNSKNDLPQILKGYPHIEKVNTSFFPFWMKSFPENPSAISVNATST